MTTAERIVARWRRHWFQELSLADLGVARALLAAIALYLNHGGRFLRTAMVGPEHWSPIPLASLLGIEQPTLAQLYWMGRATRLALVMAGLGLLTNVSLAVALCLQLLQETYLNCLGKVTHGTIPLLYALLFFAIAPCGRAFSLDALLLGLRARVAGLRPPPAASTSPYAGWPLELLFVELAAFYFQAGCAKLAAAGLGWADGYTLQYYLLGKGVPAGEWLAAHLWLCRALSAGVLVLELGFPLAIFVRRLRAPFLLGGFAFHLGTTALMNVTFWPVWALYLLFVPWASLASRAVQLASRLKRRAAFAPAAGTTLRRPRRGR